MKKAEFLKKLITSFSDGELREICLELEVDYEILPGMSKADKARELILYLERRERLSELSKICQELRPNVVWLSPDSALTNPKEAPHSVKATFIVLFLSADPTDASRLRLGEELREIQEKLQLAKLREHFELHQRMSIRPADISQALLDVQPQIVHFSGHGTSAGALCFENQIGESHPVQPDALAALFEQFTSQVSCVFLNACYSEKQANAIAHHIDYVIGMKKNIDDKAAIAFAVGFYQALGAGRTIEEAYKLGCVQIGLQGIPEHLTPVLLRNERDPAEPQSVKLEITPIERLENNCPHVSVVVKNRENKTVFCKAESHGIYNSSGEDVKRSISSYANHFSWAGGSGRGKKEISPNLDGIINLAKVNKRGYGISFLFDENPHSHWEAEGTYKLDLMIVGEFEGNSSRMESVGQRVMVEFAFIKKITQSSSGEVVNNSELRLLTWRLIDTDQRLD